MLYSGLWVHFEGDERFVSWLEDPAKLKNATVKVVDPVGLGPALCESKNVVTQLYPGPSEALVDWPRPPFVPYSAAASRSEEKEFTRIVLRLQGSMLTRGKVGKRFEEPDVMAGKRCGLLKVGLKKVPSEMLDFAIMHTSRHQRPEVPIFSQSGRGHYYCNVRGISICACGSVGILIGRFWSMAHCVFAKLVHGHMFGYADE